MSIEPIISALAYSEERADRFVWAALDEPEAVIARTVDIVERVVAAEASGDRNTTAAERRALPILLYICAELSATRLHRPLLKLLACGLEKIDDLLGDMVTGVHPGCPDFEA